MRIVSSFVLSLFLWMQIFSVQINPPVLAFYNSTLVTSISLPATTLTNVIVKNVVMPATGCPCRVSASYGLYYSSGASTNPLVNSYVTDGTNIFVTSQNIVPASGETSGANGAGFSSVTYANGANVTFTLEAKSNQAATITNTPTVTGGNGWMELAVMGSN